MAQPTLTQVTPFSDKTLLLRGMAKTCIDVSWQSANKTIASTTVSWTGDWSLSLPDEPTGIYTLICRGGLSMHNITPIARFYESKIDTGNKQPNGNTDVILIETFPIVRRWLPVTDIPIAAIRLAPNKQTLTIFTQPDAPLLRAWQIYHDNDFVARITAVPTSTVDVPPQMANILNRDGIWRLDAVNDQEAIVARLTFTQESESSLAIWREDGGATWLLPLPGATTDPKPVLGGQVFWGAP